MAGIVNGKEVAEEIYKQLKTDIQAHQLTPRLGVVLVGQNPASLTYVKVKKKRAEEVGVAAQIFEFPESVSQYELATSVKKIIIEQNLHGLIVQLPLPAHIDRTKILELVPPELDVDCLTAANRQKLESGQPLFVPPAAGAVMAILKHYDVDLKGKRVLVVGTGDLIGKPIIAMLRAQGIKPDIVDLLQGSLAELGVKADVIISGTGKAGLIKGEHVKQGAVVIDAGTAGTDKGVVGDVDAATVEPKTSLFSGVPGGVGPVTVAILLQNVVNSAMSVHS